MVGMHAHVGRAVLTELEIFVAKIITGGQKAGYLIESKQHEQTVKTTIDFVRNAEAVYER